MTSRGRRPPSSTEESSNLFDRIADEGRPLPDRMRPETLADVIGQRALLAEGKLLRRAIASDRVPSLVLWGPPGSGKTSLARVIARESRAHFVSFSAVLGGVPELRKVIAEAEDERRRGRRTILFVDEIHRFNRAQQDALLPHVERGTVTLIGATTENPSFAVNAALLSRARVLRLEPHTPDDLEDLLSRALRDETRGLGGQGYELTDEARRRLAEGAEGDARRALDALDVAAHHVSSIGSHVIDLDAVEQALAARHLSYDKSGEEHYNVVSAFIKSMRGSDPDGAIYWMMRMLEAGEDPRFVLRRMIIFASEDVGNADPRALTLAVDADRAFARLGMPEGIFAMAQCCVYLAAAPKSNASYVAFTRAKEDIERTGTLPVPLHLRNAPTGMMRAFGYGQGYRYPHDEGGFATGAQYLPNELRGSVYYEPKQSGLEARIREHLARLRRVDESSDS